jgi:histidinol-phosphate aminotransferase
VTDDPLRFHGDQEAAPGLLDAAVNVRLPGPPDWLAARLADALGDLGRYPDPGPARSAVAARHGRPEGEVLLTAGAAEAFVLLARALRPRRAICVHPSFTEPEAALTAAGIEVERVVLAPPFRLDPELVPADADLVVLGNPTNPTSVLHPAEVIERLARPGRVLVVDEAFSDFTPGEPASVAARRGLPGLVVVRSLTKMWGLAGLRVGYLLGPEPLVAACAAAQPAWSVSTPALVAAQACSTPAAVAEAAAAAAELARCRDALAADLAVIPGVEVSPGAAGPFLLLRVPRGAAVRLALRELGVAVRRCDTFPGLSADWLRVAVRNNESNAALARALSLAVARSGSVAGRPLPKPSPRIPADLHQEAR